MMRADGCGLYLHVPFCLKKCNYCDFCSFSDVDIKMRKVYISRLVREIYEYKRDERIKLDTLFFGGGTPSLLSGEEMKFISDAIYDVFDVCEGAEFTIESNPKTLSKENLDSYVRCGVNRISIGLQSMHENEMKILGRVHNYSDFLGAYKMTCDAGISNIAIDVMYGIPEQTLVSFQETLKAVTELLPSHISAYGLILEEGTPFWDMKKSLSLPTEDEECDMYEFACSYLREAGYSHYEISNYAKSGYHSLHNMKYWTMGEFIGIGASAYSFFGGKRYANSSNLREYISSCGSQYNCASALNVDDLAYEYVMLGLRTEAGISLSKYKEISGVDFLSGRHDSISSYARHGYLTLSGDRLALSEKGFYISNTILTDLL